MTAVALRDLRAHKLRTALTCLALALGVMSITATLVFTDGADRSSDRFFETSNSKTDAVVTSREVVDPGDRREPPFPDAVLEQVQAAEGVEEATAAIVDQDVTVLDKQGEPVGEKRTPTYGVSVLPDRFDPLTYDGRAPREDGELAIDERTAEAGGFEIGDRIVVEAKEEAQTYALVGITSLGGVDPFAGASVAVFTLAEARRVTRKPRSSDEILVAAAPGVSPEALQSRLASALPPTVEVETAAENADSRSDLAGEPLSALKVALLVFGGALLLIAAWLLYHSFSVAVARRGTELAMLETVGATARQLTASVVLEGVLIGLLATVLGFAAGVAAAPLVDVAFEALDFDLTGDGTTVSLRTVLVAVVLGIGLPVLAALVAALRITRAPSVMGLRRGAGPAAGPNKVVAVAAVLVALGIAAVVLALLEVLTPDEVWAAAGCAAVVVGVALLSPGLVLLLARPVGKPVEVLRGVPARIARRHAVRRPSRAGATAVPLVIGLALVTFAAIAVQSLERSTTTAFDQATDADLVLSNKDGHSDMSVGVVSFVGDLEGVDAASAIRLARARTSGDETSDVTLVDTATVTPVMKLDWRRGNDALLAGLGPDDAVIDEEWGAERDLGVGDTFTSGTATGENLTYTVRGTFFDGGDLNGDYVVSADNAGVYGVPDSARQVLVGVADGQAGAAALDDIEKTLDTRFPTVDIESPREHEEALSDDLDPVLVAVYVLLALAVIASLVGIAATVATAVHDRRRELVVLHVIGMTRGQVQGTVRHQSTITLLIGAALGMALGVLSAVVVFAVLDDEGFSLSIPAADLAILLGVTLVAGMIAAAIASRRASGLDAPDAMA